jgi:hypothetical protein
MEYICDNWREFVMSTLNEALGTIFALLYGFGTF